MQANKPVAELEGGLCGWSQCDSETWRSLSDQLSDYSSGRPRDIHGHTQTPRASGQGSGNVPGLVCNEKVRRSSVRDSASRQTAKCALC